MKNLDLINALMLKSADNPVKLYDPMRNEYYDIQDVVAVETEEGDTFIELL